MLEKFLIPQSIIILLISLLGSIFDCKYRKIPNWLNFGTVVLVLIYHSVHLDLNGLIQGLLGFIVGIAVLFIPYLMGGMGAGDVKLLGAIGSIVGFKKILWIFFYSGISGLFLGIIWIIFSPGHLKFLITTGRVLPTVDKKQKLPYGVAIMFGVIAYIILGTDKFVLF